MKNQKIPYINLIGSIVFILLTLRQVFVLGGVVIGYLQWPYGFGYFLRNIWSVLPLTALSALMAYALLTNWRSPIPVYGMAAYAVLTLLSTMLNMGSALISLDFGRLFLNVPSLLQIAGIAAIAAMGAAYLTDFLPNLRPLARKFWYAPGALFAFASLICMIITLIRGSFSFSYLYYNVLMMAGTMAVSMFFAAPSSELGSVLPLISTGFDNVSSSGSSSGSAEHGDGFINMALHVLLLFFGLGIWLYIWIYRTTKFLNKTPGNPERSPVAQLLLCMFVPFYIIFWVHNSAKRIDQLAAYQGISCDIATLCLILEIFVPIVPPIVMQSKINTIAQASVPVYSRPTPPQHRPAPALEQPEIPVYERPVTPVQERPATPVQNRPVAPIQQRPAAPVQNRPVPSRPAAPRPAAPVQRRPAAPVQGRPAAPVQNRPAAPVQERPAAPVQAPAAPRLNQAAVEELRLYKELLDSGIITQEEFLAHKRRILG